jgi:hypothetical protein
MGDGEAAKCSVSADHPPRKCVPSLSHPFGILPIVVIGLIFAVNRLAPTPYRNKVQFTLLVAFVTYILAAVVLGLVHQVTSGGA